MVIMHRKPSSFNVRVICCILMHCAIFACATGNASWSISKTNIVECEGVLLKGTVSLTSILTNNMPVIVTLNNEMLSGTNKECFNWEHSEAGNLLYISVNLFYDYSNNRMFFNEEGEYKICVKSKDNLDLATHFVFVRGSSLDKEPALNLFTNKQSLAVLLTKRYDKNGIANLNKLTDLYPDTIWSDIAKVGVGISLFEKTRLLPIYSRKDIEIRQEKLSDLAPYFVEASTRQLGEFTEEAMFYLSQCLVFSNDFEKADKIFCELESMKNPKLSGRVKKMRNQLKNMKARRGLRLPPSLDH